MSATEQVAAVERAVEKTEERLEFLARVPQADSLAAKRAVDGLMLEILDRFYSDVREAVGRPVASPLREEEPRRVVDAPQG